MSERSIRLVIADDEPLARTLLESMVDEEPDFNLVGSATNGQEALDLIESTRPDVAILDIQMPGPSGLDIARKLTPGPLLVFATAFDQHAVTAFELHALDYLLKPFGRKRFREAAVRIRQTLLASKLIEGVQDRASGALATRAVLERIYVRDGGRIVSLDAAEISHVRAADDFVEIHSRSTEASRWQMHLVAVRMKDLAERLDPARFVRIHRSWLVNRGYIKEILPAGGGRATVILTHGSELPASRAGYRLLRQSLPVVGGS